MKIFQIHYSFDTFNVKYKKLYQKHIAKNIVK